MRKFNYLSLILLLTFLITLPLNVYAKEKDKDGKRSLRKTAQGPAQNVLNINDVTSWIGSDGYHDWVVAGSYNGAYPKGTAVGSIFAEGIVWGGQVDDGQTPRVRVNGNDYGSGCQSIFDEPRVYRVRPDFQTGSLGDDAASFFDKSLGAVSEGDINAIKAQYEADWIEWPVQFGAPYLDADSNGVYEPDPNGNGLYGESGEDVPGIPAASQTVFIAYDDALSATLYQCPPIGLEVRETYWAYAYTGALANVIYKKVDVIYRGTPRSSPTSIIRNFYFLQWSDPDVGTSSDDFMGCDTTLNMGYAYNSTAEDATYGGIGLAPAAMGFDYLQGVSQFTGNPADSAIFNLRWRKGYKYVNSKPMSSAIYYAAGGEWGDPDYTYQGALEYYNYMRGLKPDGTPFPDEVRDEIPGVGTYLLAGDPTSVPPSGKLDGVISAPGDRRLLVINGPVDFRLGDTAEVVIALVGGLGGADNLENIKIMKENDLTAQIVFDQLFQLPTLPPPDVSIAQLENRIILNWGGNADLASRIEQFSSQGYTFEGYEVYQLLRATSNFQDPNESVLLGTFDVPNGITTILDTVEQSGVLLPVITAVGTDRGVQRYLEVSRNPFRGNQPLRNGQEYYFAVVPYAFNPDPLLPFHALRSAVVIKVGIPQSPNPGVRYSSAAGDTIQDVVHSTGISDGSVIPIVVDPTRTTGHEYRVTFQDNAGQTQWSVVNATTGGTVVSGQTNESGDETYPVVDGVLVKVLGPPPGIKRGSPNSTDDETQWGWDIPQGTRRFTWAGGAFGFEAFGSAPAEGGLGALGWDSPYHTFGGGEQVIAPTELNNVLLILAKVDFADDYDPPFDPNDPNMSFAYRYGRGFANDPAQPQFEPHMINRVGGYSFQDFTKNMPISAWNVDDPANPQRLALGWLENNSEGGLVDGKYWPGNNSTTDNVGAAGPREWLFIFKTPYSETIDTNLAQEMTSTPLPVMYWATWNRRGAAPFSPGASGDDHFAIFPTKPNTPNDVFTFTAPGRSESADLAKVDVEMVNVYPNPYYGTHYRESSRDAKYVTFNHLPGRATIRIFDLSGVMVRTLQHNDPNPVTSQQTRWDLKNNDNYPVASGIYIVHIDMPDLGATKVLKLAIVQEEQILKVY